MGRGPPRDLFDDSAMTSRHTRTVARGVFVILVAGWVSGTCGIAHAARGVDPLAGWLGPRYEAPPEALGFDPDALARAVADVGAMKGVQGVLVQRDGYLVAERYWRGGARERPHNLKSMTKSVISALVGIAIEEGHLRLDQPIVELLVAARELHDPAKRRITVRHLLTMTSGLESTSYRSYGSWVESDNWVVGALAAPLRAEPGRRYQYSTGSTHLLSAIIAAATGMSTRAFAESRLFDPLGIEIAGWETDPQGVHAGGNNLSLPPRDIIKLGQLYLNGGRWGARQIVPRWWVTASLRTAGADVHDTYGGYGFLWWVQPEAGGDFAALGFGGQLLHVSPRTGLVVTVISTLDSKGARWESEMHALLTDGIIGRLRPVPPPQVSAPTTPESISVGPSTGPVLASASVRLSMRAVPTSRGRRLAVLDAGTSFEVRGREAGWLEVRAGGREGWVHGDYVELVTPLPRDLPERVAEAVDAAPGASPMPALGDAGTGGAVGHDDAVRPEPTRATTLRAELARLRGLLGGDTPASRRLRTTGRAAFRATPGLAGARIRLLPDGAEFEPLERAGSWVRARIDGAEGWVHTDLVERVGPSALPRAQPDFAAELAAIADSVERLVEQSRAADLLGARRDEDLLRLQDELAREKERAERVRSERAQVRAARTEEVERARAASQARRETVARLEARAVEVEAEREQLARANEELSREVAQLRRVRAALEVERAQIAESARDEASRASQRLEAQAEVERAELARTRSALADVEGSLEAMESARNQALRVNEALGRELEASRRATEDAVSYRDRIATLEDELRRVREVGRISSERITRLGAEIRSIGSVASAAREPRSRRRTIAHVNFRVSPTMSAARVAVLPPETQFDVLEREGGWLRAVIDGRDGWIHSDYARAADTEAPGEVAVDAEAALGELSGAVTHLAGSARVDRERVSRLERLAVERAAVLAGASSRAEAERAARERAAAQAAVHLTRLDEVGARVAALEAELAHVSQARVEQERQGVTAETRVGELERALTEARSAREGLEGELARERGSSASATAVVVATSLDPISEIETVVRSWADAWSRQDVAAYLAFDAQAFQPRGGASRAGWVSERRKRLTTPDSISVAVTQLEVGRTRDDRARVTFVQNYRSSHYQDHVRKILLLSRVGGAWRIVREISRPLESAVGERQ
jgi:CubicO group peptidase (beta-lactamase class C family)/uncharacterized protein YraI